MIVHRMPQRSDEWRAVRVGKLTSSKAADAVSFLKDGKTESAARRDYRLQLVAERLTGRPCESDYVNDAMQWGIDHEAEALHAYEALTGNLVTAVGFVELDGQMMGCSPDGMVNDFEGTVSIKCPKTATHIRYLRENRIPPDYLPQILCELLVTGANWCDFVSFDPRLPDDLQLFVIRYKFDEAAMDAFSLRAMAFLEETERETAALLGWKVLATA